MGRIEALGLAAAFAINGFFGAFLPHLSLAPFPAPVSIFLMVAGLISVSGIVCMRQHFEIWGLTLMGASILPIVINFIVVGEKPGRILATLAIVGALLTRAVYTWYLRVKSRD